MNAEPAGVPRLPMVSVAIEQNENNQLEFKVQKLPEP